jgi:hypothetical protein
LTHENDCTGVPATKGYLGDLMCRACAAWRKNKETNYICMCNI